MQRRNFEQPLTDSEYSRSKHLFREIEHLNDKINANFNDGDKVKSLRSKQNRLQRELDKLSKRMERRERQNGTSERLSKLLYLINTLRENNTSISSVYSIALRQGYSRQEIDNCYRLSKLRQRNGARRNFAIETDDEEIAYLQARQDPYFQDVTDIRELSEMFQGQLIDEQTELLITRYGVPNLARLGNLEYVILEISGSEYQKIEFDDNISFLCADRRGNLYLAGIGCVFESSDRPELGQILNLGRVYEIMYRTCKAHIENNNVVSFYHNLGEVDGVLPYLAIDDEGFPLPLIGGNYTIKREGVIN